MIFAVALWAGRAVQIAGTGYVNIENEFLNILHDRPVTSG